MISCRGHVLVWRLPGGFAGEDLHRLATRRLRAMLAARARGAAPEVRHETGSVDDVLARCRGSDGPRVLVLPTFREHLWSSLELVSQLAVSAPDLPVLLSGWGTDPDYLDAACGDRPLRHPRLAAVRGEVEEGLVDAVECLLGTDGWPVDDLIAAGLAVPDGAGGWRSRGRFREVADLAALPSPILDGDLDPGETDGMALIEVSRGCLHGCGYCLSCNYARQVVRWFPAARIRAELERSVALGARAVGLLGSGLNYDVDQLEAIAGVFESMDPGRRPTVESTIHTAFLDDRRLDAVRRLPWRRMIIGLQSINPDALAVMRRRVDPDRFRAAIETIAELHTPVVEIILGLPGDTLEGFAATVRFALDLPAAIEVYCLRLDPGARFMRDRETLGLVADFRREGRVVATPTFSAADLDRAAQALRRLRGRRWPFRARRLAVDFELVYEAR